MTRSDLGGKLYALAQYIAEPQRTEQMVLAEQITSGVEPSEEDPKPGDPVLESET